MTQIGSSTKTLREREVGVPTRNQLTLIWNERWRQECMKAEGRFEFTCADDGLSNAEKLTILVEEVGEVAREVLTQDGQRLARDTVGTKVALHAELIQVAAVCVAWAEALER